MFKNDDNDSFIKLINKYNISVKKNEYTEQFNNYYYNKSKYDEYIKNKICSYIREKLTSLNNIDINEIISNFNYLINTKINNIYEDIGITEIIEINTQRGYNNRSVYNKYLYDIILKDKRENQNNKDFATYFSESVENINIDSLSKMSALLERINFFSIKNENVFIDDINNIRIIISEMFDEEENINKLIKYIQNMYINDDESYELTPNKKNIKYLLNNMKCDGYLFFKNYLTFIKNKYRTNKINIMDVNKDRKIINYFILILKDKKSNISIIINKLLLNIKIYINGGILINC